MPKEIDPSEPQLRQLLAYWEAKRGDRRLPARGDIDPAEIPQLLPDLIMVDTGPTLDSFRYRLFGTRVCAGFGHERTGMRFSDLPRIENFDAVYEDYWLTCRERAPHYFHGQIASLPSEFSTYSRLLLPLSSDGEEVDIILGGFVFFPAQPSN